MSPLDVDGHVRRRSGRTDLGLAARRVSGCGLVNEPGYFCWSERACRDTEAATRFCGRVFGWEAETSQMGPMTCTGWRPGGMVHMDENRPEGVTPRWVAYFAATDCDAAAARAAGLDGQVAVPPADALPGRLA